MPDSAAGPCPQPSGNPVPRQLGTGFPVLGTAVPKAWEQSEHCCDVTRYVEDFFSMSVRIFSFCTLLICFLFVIFAHDKGILK